MPRPIAERLPSGAPTPPSAHGARAAAPAGARRAPQLAAQPLQPLGVDPVVVGQQDTHRRPAYVPGGGRRTRWARVVADASSITPVCGACGCGHPASGLSITHRSVYSEENTFTMLWLILGIVLLIIAIAGGAIIHPILFVLAILALFMFVTHFRGRGATY